MPAYVTTQLDFPLARTDGLVRDVYAAFARAGAPFTKVHAWGCPPDLSFDSIVEWNQTKLSSGFRLGRDEHVSHNYRQVFVAFLPFDYARLYLSLGPSGVGFHLIVPESEVEALGADPILALGREVFRSLGPRSIQTYGEGAAAVPHNELLAGTLPSADLFAFLGAQYPEPRSSALLVETIEGGRLLIPPTG